MKRVNRTNVMLLAMVLLLCAGVVAELQREEWLLSKPLTALKNQHIHSIVVSCADCRARRFEMLQGRWWMREPYAMAANPESIARLLAIAQAPVRKRRAATEFDPAKLGLSPPQALLSFGDVRIEFGGTDAINGDRYVRLHDEIALVPDRFSAWLMAPAESELDHHLVPIGGQVRQLRVDGIEHADLIPAWVRAETGQVVAAKSTSGEPGDASHRIELDLADGETLRYSLRRDGADYVAVRAQPALAYGLEEKQVRGLLPASGQH
ncbi:MAG: DUF4340 domain-containing protein [Tahibacter sp.]